jgi:hypothetical protein
LEAEAMPIHSRNAFRMIICTAEDAAAADHLEREAPDALVVRRIVVAPPQRDADGNVIAPARSYLGPIVV